MYRSSGSFELLLAPLLFGLLGLWLDARVGTRPVFAVTLAVLAVLGAFCRQYFGYRHAMAQAAADRLQLRKAAEAARQRDLRRELQYDTEIDV